MTSRMGLTAHLAAFAVARQNGMNATCPNSATLYDQTGDHVFVGMKHSLQWPWVKMLCSHLTEP
jgi:hypothetical protein